MTPLTCFESTGFDNSLMGNPQDSLANRPVTRSDSPKGVTAERSPTDDDPIEPVTAETSNISFSGEKPENIQAYPGSIRYVDARLDDISQRFQRTIDRTRQLVHKLLTEGVRTPSVVTSEDCGVDLVWHCNGWDVDLTVGHFDEDDEGPTLWARRRSDLMIGKGETVPLSSARARAILMELRHV